MKRAMVDCRVERSWWLAGWLAGSGWLDCLSFSLSLPPRGMCTTLVVVEGKRRKGKRSGGCGSKGGGEGGGGGSEGERPY